MDCPEARKVQVEVATVRPRSFSHTPASQSSATPQQLSKASRCGGMGGGGRREAIEQDLKKLRAEREDLDGRIRLLESELEAVPVPAGGSGGAIPSRLPHHLRPPLSDMDCPEAKKIQVEVACLPFDSLVEIFSRLHAKPLFRFKCVSKDWCGLIADRLRCRKFPFPQTLQGFFSGGAVQNYGGFIDLSGRLVPLVDPSFSFLTKSPEIEKIDLLSSCNGLFLFGHSRVSDMYDSLGYIVCNPATEEWVSVPSSGYTPLAWYVSDSDGQEKPDDVPDTYLIFDPAISPHFQLVQLRFDDQNELHEVHTFSSLTRAWRQELDDVLDLTRGLTTKSSIASVGCPLNGMLHVSAYQRHFPPGNRDMILAIGGEGSPLRTLHWPRQDLGFIIFLGQSQGHLHCLSGHIRKASMTMNKLSIWVLKDYNAEKWVLRDNVSISQLFGRTGGHDEVDWNVVGIHPDRGLVFFAEYWNHKLISYDMDKKEVCVLCSLHGYHWPIIPYVPYFAQSAALAKKR